MTKRAIQFLYIWLEKNDLLEGRFVDDDAIVDLAARLFLEAEAAGIDEREIEKSVADLGGGLAEMISRRHPAPASKQ